ncbi:MAG: tannase/feruloyl esterase family alpha/beta hydrolase [Pseudomonadota bacterium]
MNNVGRIFSVIGLVIVALSTVPAYAENSCEDLKNFKMPQLRVDSVDMVTPTDTIDFGMPILPPVPANATFCRVLLTLTPTKGSSIRSEVWLPPLKDWNGKFIGTGNGGLAGSLNPPHVAMRDAVARGYATAGTDTGHVGEGEGWSLNGAWALGHPERVKDYGYRSNHVTAVAAKALIKAHYNKAQKYSYFQGCSNGGREALMEAQRFPYDYDGIVAGAPANEWTGISAGFAWNTKAVTETPDSALPDDKLAVLQDAVIKQCDLLDGVADGILEDPRRCVFNPAVVQCTNGNQADCLSAAQVEAAKKIYQGPRNSKTGAQMYPGYPVGSEAVQWSQWITGPKADQAFYANELFRNMVHEDATWDLSKLNLDADYAKSVKKIGPILNSNKPDMSVFAKKGGKLILYHGWADGALTPLGTIKYYERLHAKMGAAATAKFMRFYMAPGLAHCIGGPGPNDFDMLKPLEQWVENKTAPDTIIASKYENEYAKLLGMEQSEPVRTRPLCQYPKVAHWKGSGSTDKAENFECRADK